MAAPDSKIWLGTRDSGLFYLPEGGGVTAVRGSGDIRVRSLLPARGPELWVGASEGVWHWNGTSLSRDGVPSSLLQVAVLSMIRDRDSNIWIGTNRGLLRFNASGVSSLARNDASAVAEVTALFEDREGNLWMGGTNGIERLRDSAFATYSVPGLTSQSMGPVYAAPDDSVWFAPGAGGLRRMKEGKTASIDAAGMAQDIVYSIAGSGDELWIGRQRGGLTYLRHTGSGLAAKTYKLSDGLAQDSVFAVHHSRNGAIWAGTLSAGVSELQNGQFTNYKTADGLASNTITSIAEGSDGTMWFGTPTGLSAKSPKGWRTYTASDGLPSREVNCLLEDSTGALWIGTSGGLAFLAGGRIHSPRKAPDSLREQIFGIAEDKEEWLWVATANHVLQVKRSSLTRDVWNELDFREYGLADGLWGTEGVKRWRSVTADPQGRVWFSTNRGLSVVTPSRARVNSLPALVHIEAVEADGDTLNLRQELRFSSAARTTTFRYAGLSLGNAERVRYRYRLDGYDHEWSEPATNRDATYHLAPGSYRFRVIASNSDGLWNSADAAIGLEVEPEFWQTWWFRLACVLAVGLATLAIYLLRMRHVTRLMNVRFEERLAERGRIAQDLHDNLLQGVLSLSMQLQVAADQLPADSPARARMNRILQLTKQVVDEGRNTLRGLRSSIENPDDLVTSLSQVPKELGEQKTPFRIVVEGSSKPLRPAIRDDVYCIGREALLNAFRHSMADSIDLRLEYRGTELRMQVRDNGRGIDPRVIGSSRDVHQGLSRMRERAERIGAKIRVLSRAGGGTEVEVRVRNRVAFETRNPIWVAKWMSRFHQRHPGKAVRQIPKPNVG
jgi:signal transduction histidine kinase/ligand-binding sensor domain-containing protein